MKAFRLLVLVLPLFLAACAMSDQQKADYATVQASRVSPAIYDKMMHGDALSLYDIEALTRAHVSDGVILRYLRDHETIYYLISKDVQELAKAGVSQSIIDYMLQTGQMNPPPYYGPYYGPYGGPYPYWGPGPVFFIGGGGHYHHWR